MGKIIRLAISGDHAALEADAVALAHRLSGEGAVLFVSAFPDRAWERCRDLVGVPAHVVFASNCIPLPDRARMHRGFVAVFVDTLGLLAPVAAEIEEVARRSAERFPCTRLFRLEVRPGAPVRTMVEGDPQRADRQLGITDLVLRLRASIRSLGSVVAVGAQGAAAVRAARLNMREAAAALDRQDMIHAGALAKGMAAIEAEYADRMVAMEAAIAKTRRDLVAEFHVRRQALLLEGGKIRDAWMAQAFATPAPAAPSVPAQGT